MDTIAIMIDLYQVSPQLIKVLSKVATHAKANPLHLPDYQHHQTVDSSI